MAYKCSGCNNAVEEKPENGKCPSCGGDLVEETAAENAQEGGQEGGDSGASTEKDSS